MFNSNFSNKFNGIEEVKNFIQDNPKCIVKFSAEWCLPCKSLNNTLHSEEIAKLLEDNNLKILNVHMLGKGNLEENKVLEYYKIKALPTLLFFNNQSVFLSLKGNVEKSELIQQITHFIKY